MFIRGLPVEVTVEVKSILEEYAREYAQPSGDDRAWARDRAAQYATVAILAALAKSLQQPTTTSYVRAPTVDPASS